MDLLPPVVSIGPSSSILALLKLAVMNLVRMSSRRSSLSATLGSECSRLSEGSASGDLRVSSSPVNSGVWGLCVSASIYLIRPLPLLGPWRMHGEVQGARQRLFSIRENRWFAEDNKN